MGTTALVKAFTEKYMFKVFKDNGGDYVYKKSLSIRYGVTVWNQGDSYWVVRYPTCIAMGLTVLLWVFIDHVLNFGSTSWFTKIFDYNYPIATALYSYSFYSHEDEIGRVSLTLDEWYDYTYLETVQNELKRRAENKVNKFNYIYYNFMKVGSVAYCTMPIWRYYRNASKDASSLLLFQSWSPVPLTTWWGFSITYLFELLTILILFIVFGSIITYLIAVVITVGYQCQLISISLVTVDQRVRRMVAEMAVQRNGPSRFEAHTLTTKNELRKSIIHFQRIYGLTKLTCKFFTGPVSMCYYPGIFALVMCCGKLATKSENKFLLFQVSFMSMAILLNQYLIAVINQIITDKIEGLQLAVYESPWHTLQVPCRKMIHIFQTMMLRKPNIKTCLGTRADMEFFATVVNASYCYLSALLSMNVNY